MTAPIVYNYISNMVFSARCVLENAVSLFTAWFFGIISPFG